MFSTITIELSTTNPTLSINPIMVMIFKVQPMKYRKVTVINNDRGIARLIIIVILMRRKKKYNIRNANIPPHIAAFRRLSIDSVMNFP